MTPTLGFVPVVDPAAGGIYQYSATMATALSGLAASGEAVAVVPPDAPSVAALDGWPRLELEALAPRVPTRRFRFISAPRARRAVRRSIGLLRAEEQLDPDAVRPRPAVGAVLADAGIELMLFSAPLALAFEIGLPYVIAIHDLQHRLQPEFPEVSASGIWEQREYLFRNGARYASAVLAESEVGREDILTAYGPHGLAAERVFVLPYVPPPALRAGADESAVAEARRVYRLPERYLFYPAQFWPHKNHARLVDALAVLRRRGVEVPLVLAGSHGDARRERTFAEAMRRAEAGGVRTQLHVLGYVPEEHMRGLYGGAAALAFPTFFGPTNIPVLEAWALGCPVVTSDIRGIREQVGDAAALADPRDTEAIARAIQRVWTDGDFRARLVAAGRRRVAAFTPDDFGRALLDSLDRARALGQPRPAVTAAA